MKTFKIPGTVTRTYETEVTITAESLEDAIAKAKEQVSGDFAIDEANAREVEIIYRDRLFEDWMGRPLRLKSFFN